jgi:hypothetical protein
MDTKRSRLMRRFLVGEGTPVLRKPVGAPWNDRASWTEHVTQNAHEFTNADLVADPSKPINPTLPRGAARWTARNYAVAGHTLFKKNGYRSG